MSEQHLLLLKWNFSKIESKHKSQHAKGARKKELRDKHCTNPMQLLKKVADTFSEKCGHLQESKRTSATEAQNGRGCIFSFRIKNVFEMYFVFFFLCLDVFNVYTRILACVQSIVACTEFCPHFWHISGYKR